MTVSTGRGHGGPGNEQFRHDLPEWLPGLEWLTLNLVHLAIARHQGTLALPSTREGNMSSVILWRYSFTILFCFSALIGMPPGNVDGTPQQEAQQKTSPEMDRLRKLYLGSWDYTETYSKTPFYPQGGSDTGVYTRRPD